MRMAAENGLCAGCGKPMPNGRRDRKFHSPSCRNAAWRAEHPRVKRRRPIALPLSFNERLSLLVGIDE